MLSIDKINEILIDRKRSELDRAEAIKENVDPGFNLFNLISDLYYRENLHSDIIKAILDVNGKHGAGNKYLLILVGLINKSQKVKVDPTLYKTEVEVVREKGRRDVTILGSGNHAIIIENKLNDAYDTWNQIPKYVEQLEKQKITVDAILYLTLNHTKEPDEATWKVKEEQREQIKSKLVSIRAYDGTANDLCSGWLEECIKTTNDVDALSILRQYLKIIKYLTRNHMDQQFLQEFEKYLKGKPENALVAIGIRDTLSDYAQYLHNKIFNYYNANSHAPFQYVQTFKGLFPFLRDYRIANCAFNSDIIVTNNLEKCTVDFSVREQYEWQKEHPEEVLKTIGLLDKFEWNGKRFVHTIEGNFIEFEDKAINFINQFLTKLKENKDKIEVNLLNVIEQKKTVVAQ